MSLGLLLLAAPLALALACGDKDDTGDEAATWVEVETSFTNSCAFSTCHGGGQFPDLSEGNAYDAIVGVESQDAPGEILVVAGGADASYLVAKVEGAAGITGDPMPFGSDAWDDASISALRSWIDAGAAP